MIQFYFIIQIWLLYVLSIYMYFVSKPFPSLMPILWIVYWIYPSLFDTKGQLGQYMMILSQWAYVIKFQFLSFSAFNFVGPFTASLNNYDFLFLNIWSCFLSLAGNIFFTFTTPYVMFIWFG